MVPVAEAGLPEEGQVYALELGEAEVLPAPGLDVLDAVHDDGPPQHVAQAEDVRLLQAGPRLTGQTDKTTGTLYTIQESDFSSQPPPSYGESFFLPFSFYFRGSGQKKCY